MFITWCVMYVAMDLILSLVLLAYLRVIKGSFMNVGISLKRLLEIKW
jgi:hypothetical protein